MTAFFVKSCTLPAISLGKKAHSLIEFHKELHSLPNSCLYMHFWGNRLFPRFVYPDFHNDFAIWAHDKIHDQFLAERLCILDPVDFLNLDELKQSLIKTVEQRMEEVGAMVSSQQVESFNFVDSKLIIYDTPLKIENPQELSKIVPLLPPSSIFYHFIDAKMRTPTRIDDFSNWLKDYHDGYQQLIDKIQSIDASFLSLGEIKKELIHVLNEFDRNKKS